METNETSIQSTTYAEIVLSIAWKKTPEQHKK